MFYHKAKTSGSTGIPLIIYKDTNGIAGTYASMYSGHSWHGADVGSREARLWGVPVNSINRIKGKATDFLLNRVRQDSSNLCDESFAKFYVW